MARTVIRQSKKPAPAPKPEGADAPWKRLTRGAFFLSLVLVVVRATIQEIVRGDALPVPGGVSAPAMPGATTGLVLDLLCCLPAFLVLVRRLLDRTFVLRLAWSHWLMFLLAAWTFASVLWADDKFIAVVNASHWVAALVLLWSTSQLVRNWLRLRVIAAVGFGLLLVLLVQGYYYRFVDLPDLQRGWHTQRTEWLQQRGTAPNSAEAIQLGKNIESGEVTGFSFSRNTYAAVLVLLIVLSAGVVVQRGRDGDPFGWVVPILLVIALALLMLDRYVQSKTAFATPVIGMLLLLLIGRCRGWLARHAKRLYWGGVGFFALAVAAVVGHGLKHGTLLHISLTFRWWYWVGAARLFMHHPWLGVGWANFGPHYLAYRLPQAAEEPADPHNFLVRAFVELGIVGGILMLAWMLRLWWELTQDPTTPAAQPSSAAPDLTQRGARYPALPFLIAFSVVAIGLNAAVSIDWTQPSAWIFLECFKRLLFLLALLGGMSIVAIRSFDRQELDDRPAWWLLAAMLVGLGLFLLHNLIDFSLFEPGPMLLFALLAGGALGLRLPVRQGWPRGRAFALSVFVVAGAAWIVAAAAGVWNVAQAESLAQDADGQIRQNNPERARDELVEAFHLVPINADYAFRAEQAAIIAHGSPLVMRELLAAAITTDPSSVRYRQARAELEAATGDPSHAWADYEQALRLNPHDLELRLEYARLLREHGRGAEARTQYQKTLEFNSKLAPDEIRRLSPQRVDQIKKWIATLPAS